MKQTTHIEFNREKNKKDPKFEVGHQVRISRHKNTFTKGCIWSSSKEDFIFKTLKILCLWVKKLIECFT